MVDNCPKKKPKRSQKDPPKVTKKCGRRPTKEVEVGAGLPFTTDHNFSL
jgi:hypothetical protein